MTNFGTIERLKSGKFRARYTGPDGNRYTAPGTFWDEVDAQIWLRGVHREMELGKWQPPARNPHKNDTLAAWCARWLDLQTHLKPATRHSYQRVLNSRILNTPLAGLPVSAVTRARVMEWWDTLQLEYPTPAINNHARMLLKTVMQAAVERDMVTVNPVQVKRIPHATKRKQLPTTEQLDMLVERVAPRYKLLAVLCFFHGLRAGEACALRRRDVVEVPGGFEIHVQGTMSADVDGHPYRSESPKTRAGRRIVPVWHRFNQLMKDWLTAHPGGPDDPLCMGVRGTWVAPGTLTAACKNTCKKWLPGVHITPHNGRVWLITTLAEAGMPIPAIGEILGQRDLKTITETYMRASEDKKRSVLERVNARLDGAAS